jgi:membrane fusion protein (multidrug efflux system)
MNTTVTPPVDPAKNFPRKKIFKFFFIFLAILAVVYAIYFFIVASHYETTDNAYVSAPQIQIASQVEGTVSDVLVAETQLVHAGDTLFKIDTTEAKIASEIADADLSKALRAVRGNILMARERMEELTRARDEYDRRKSLTGVAAYSADELARFKTQFDTAQTAYDQALENADGITDLSQVTKHSDVQRAMASSKKAYVSLLRADVQSPVKAVVARRQAQVGQRVSPGVPLATLVLSDAMWVDANFKENQLSNMRIGQPVELEADVYGNHVKFSGKVSGFSPGTGSSLAVLPAQNATGNWVKVVQRLPVRIEIDSETLKKYPLRVGLTMTAKVDIRNAEGVALQSLQKNETIKTDLYDLQLEDANRHVQKIISQSFATSKQ